MVEPLGNWPVYEATVAAVPGAVTPASHGEPVRTGVTGIGRAGLTCRRASVVAVGLVTVPPRVDLLALHAERLPGDLGVEEAGDTVDGAVGGREDHRRRDHRPGAPGRPVPASGPYVATNGSCCVGTSVPPTNAPAGDGAPTGARRRRRRARQWLDAARRAGQGHGSSSRRRGRTPHRRDAAVTRDGTTPSGARRGGQPPPASSSSSAWATSARASFTLAS